MGNNISTRNNPLPCNLKCAYSFQYPTSSCVVTNTGERGLGMSYDKSNSPPVTYNGNKYQVVGLNLIPLSVHFYNENQSDAELWIEHQCEATGKYLCVVVPIIQSSGSGIATSILSQIISAASTGANKTGQKTTVNLSNYSLDNIVPSKPFYTYSANGMDIIVFGTESAIYLSEANIKTLNQLVPGSVQKKIYDSALAKKFPPLSFNKDGPGREAGGDIYIDCQPVDESDETVEISANKLGGANFDASEQFWNSPFLISFVFAIILFFFLYLIRMGVQQLSAMG